jgi:hypothetical protein
MHAQLSDGGRFFGIILIEPTSALSRACCATSFILLTNAVPFGSNFARGFIGFSVFAMVIPLLVVS